MQGIEANRSGVPRKISMVGIRANVPKILGGFAVLAFAVSLIWIGFGFFASKETPFIMKGKEVQLSKDVVLVISDFERRETDGEKLKYFIKADRATTFSDNHQELENAYIEVYDETGTSSDKITSQKAIYVPNPNDSKLFNAKFTGNVNIDSRDGLKVISESVSYDRETEIAESADWTTFSRGNVNGKAFGAIVKIKEKQLQLLKDVDFAIVDEGEVKTGRITSGRAVVEQSERVATFEENVIANVVPKEGDPTEARASKIVARFGENAIERLEMFDNVSVVQKGDSLASAYATAFFGPKLEKVELQGDVAIKTSQNSRNTNARSRNAVAFFGSGLERAEMSGSVEIDSAAEGQSPSKIRSETVVFHKLSDTFNLSGDVNIFTEAGGKNTTLKAQNAVYEQSSGKSCFDRRSGYFAGHGYRSRRLDQRAVVSRQNSSKRRCDRQRFFASNDSRANHGSKRWEA
jgi:LPS export ABC transporter protein LptC